MTLFRHRGCESPIIEYTGTEPLHKGTVMRSKDWRKPDGEHPDFMGSLLMSCPDCGARIRVSSVYLEEVER